MTGKEGRRGQTSVLISMISPVEVEVFSDPPPMGWLPYAKRKGGERRQLLAEHEAGRDGRNGKDVLLDDVANLVVAHDVK
jgi:hypothetical protein